MRFDPCKNAAGRGDLDMLKWLRNDYGTINNVDDREPYEWNESVCSYAARGGHLDVLKWLRDPNRRRGPCPWNDYTCHTAIDYGHTHILEWARIECNGCWDHTACQYAISIDNLRMLKYLRYKNYPWGDNAARTAAARGYIHILQWMLLDGYDMDCEYSILLSSAQLHSNTEVLNWLYTLTY